jgi:glyoxylase-like metal-dependent hydrolase (beta-lactamase superfamily II)
MKKTEVGKPPYPKWLPWDYKISSVNPKRILEDGNVFDLGDKKLHVLPLPGHSRGSINLGDEWNVRLFSGDVVYDGPLFDYLPHSNIEDNIQLCEKLQEMVPQVKKGFLTTAICLMGQS